MGALCGKYIKKCTLELGGSDPFIVTDDVDVTATAKLAVAGRLKNSGQVCISAKRILVHENVYDQFKQELLTEIQTYKVGDPLDESTKVGPLARKDLLEGLKSQVRRAIDDGC